MKHNDSPAHPRALSRRGFLKASAIVLAVGLSGKVFATVPAALAPERKLAFYNIHTGEKLNARR